MRILELTNGDYYIHIRHNLNEIMLSAVFNWYFWLKVIHTFTFRSCISRENHVIRFHSTIFFYSWIHFFHFRLVDGDSKRPTYAPYYVSNILRSNLHSNENQSGTHQVTCAIRDVNANMLLLFVRVFGERTQTMWPFRRQDEA